MSEDGWTSCRIRPEPYVLVELLGSDCLGDWQMRGYWKPYKSPPNKPGSGRFMSKQGEPLLGKEAPDYWRPIQTNTEDHEQPE